MIHRQTTIIALVGCLCVGGLACSSRTVPLSSSGNAEVTAPQLEPAQGTLPAPEGVPQTPDKPSSDDRESWAPAVSPKELSKTVLKGLDWLVATQLPNGAWDQGDQQVRSGEQPVGSGNVADTCMATLALVRSGSSPKAGPYKGTVLKAVNFVLKEVETSDKDSLYVTNIRGTRVQSKIGTYVDTFTSLMLLTELKGTMPQAKDNARLERAIDKIISKVEKNQQDNGAWDNKGWAPVLTQSLAGKSLNRAAQSGVEVQDKTLDGVEKYSADQLDTSTGTFKASGSAGVGLYAGAANSSNLRESDNTRKAKVKQLRKDVASAKTEAKRAQAQAQLNTELRDADKTAKAAESSERALLGRLQDPNYIAGFGSNGGEEFLSYMLVSESLVVKGGDQWKQWDKTISTLLAKVQNGDGSWSGHHCITGRTFCTSAALLVLMADRTPVPVAAQVRGG